MSANEAIQANTARQSKKKVPILKGLSIIAQNSDKALVREREREKKN
jgi:hypothetical protein